MAGLPAAVSEAEAMPASQATPGMLKPAPALRDNGCEDRFPQAVGDILKKRGYRDQVDPEAERQVVAGDFDGDGACDVAAILTDMDQGGVYRLVIGRAGGEEGWRVEELHSWIGVGDGSPFLERVEAGVYRKELYGVDMGPNETSEIQSARSGFRVVEADNGASVFFFTGETWSYVAQLTAGQKSHPFLGDVCDRMLDFPAGTDLAVIEQAFGLDPALRRRTPGGSNGGLLISHNKGDMVFELRVEETPDGRYIYKEPRLIIWHGRMWQKWRDAEGRETSYFGMADRGSD